MSQEGSREEFVNLLGDLGEEPAFVRRATAPQVAMRSLLKQCESQRGEWLRWPRHHFTALRERTAGRWDSLRPLLAASFDERNFAILDRELPPLTIISRSWLASNRSLIRAFVESAKRFNRVWELHVRSDLLDNVNQLRDEYNRYYHIEKACAFGFESSVTEGNKLPMIDVDYLFERFPLLPVLL